MLYPSVFSTANRRIADGKCIIIDSWNNPAEGRRGCPADPIGPISLECCNSGKKRFPRFMVASCNAV